MEIFLHSPSPMPRPVAGKYSAQIPKIQSFPKASCSSPVFTLPNWRSGRTDPRTRELRLNDAFLYLEYMVGKGHTPDVYSATQLLYDLCRCSKGRKASRVMEMIVKSGSVPDPASYTFLVNHLCRRGNVGHAMQLVYTMEERGYPTNTMTYNALVRGLSTRGNLSKTLLFLERLMEKGLVPNAFTYAILLEAAYKEKGVDEAMRLLDDIVLKNGAPNLVSYNVILTGLCKEDRVEEAVELFRSLPDKGFAPNVVSYNILLRSLCYKGRWEEANVLLSEMVGAGDVRSPSIVTYNILIGSLAARGLTDRALEVLDELCRDARFSPDAASYNPVLARLCKEKKVDAALKCLEGMSLRKCSPNEGTYNAVALLCKEGMVREAFEIITSLRPEQGPLVDDFYRMVTSSLCRKGNTYTAFQLLHEMVLGGYVPDSYTYSSLIRGLCMEKMVGAAMGVFRVMEESGCHRPDVDNYNALVLGLCKCWRTDLSVEVLGMMVEKGYVPNETTYTILVEGIVHEQERELGAEILKELHSRRVVGRNTVARLTMQYDLDGVGIYTM